MVASRADSPLLPGYDLFRFSIFQRMLLRPPPNKNEMPSPSPSSASSSHMILWLNIDCWLWIYIYISIIIFTSCSTPHLWGRRQIVSCHYYLWGIESVRISLNSLSLSSSHHVLSIIYYFIVAIHRRRTRRIGVGIHELYSEAVIRISSSHNSIHFRCKNIYGTQNNNPLLSRVCCEYGIYILGELFVGRLKRSWMYRVVNCCCASVNNIRWRYYY